VAELLGDASKRAAVYQIEVTNSDHVSRGVKQLRLDGVALDPTARIRLEDDGVPHRIDVVLGAV
jgi:cyclic beta-1,2-glucan synthetase